MIDVAISENVGIANEALRTAQQLLTADEVPLLLAATTRWTRDDRLEILIGRLATPQQIPLLLAALATADPATRHRAKLACCVLEVEPPRAAGFRAIEWLAVEDLATEMAGDLLWLELEPVHLAPLAAAIREQPALATLLRHTADQHAAYRAKYPEFKGVGPIPWRDMALGARTDPATADDARLVCDTFGF